MSLKTNYRNDKFSGKRKYNMTENVDGTVSFDDVTSYAEQGDIFNADDINSTNNAVNDMSAGFTELKTENAQFKATMESDFSALQKSTESEISSIKGVRTVTLSASKWSGNQAPYIQEVSLSGITGSDTPIIGLYLSGSPSAETVKAQRKAYGYLDRAVTGNGKITFYCYEKKPAADFVVSVKGE